MGYSPKGHKELDTTEQLSMYAQATFETDWVVWGHLSHTVLPRPETLLWEVPVTLPSEAILT